jgi:sugar/nucleoside kinase (ribokinase family)
MSAFVPAFSVPAVDTTGAGDCFHAAYLFGYLQDWNVIQCLHFAHAAAALSVQQVGARGGLPTREQVEEFLAIHEQGRT